MVIKNPKTFTFANLEFVLPNIKTLVKLCPFRNLDQCCINIHGPTWVYGIGMSNSTKTYLTRMEVVIYLSNIVMVMDMKLGFVTSIPYHTNLDFAHCHIMCDTGIQGCKWWKEISKGMILKALGRMLRLNTHTTQLFSFFYKDICGYTKLLQYLCATNFASSLNEVQVF